MKPGAQWFSIFGEIEELVAGQMVQEGKASMLNRRPELFHPSVKFNAMGQTAKFAVIVPNKHVAEFEERIASLRA